MPKVRIQTLTVLRACTVFFLWIVASDAHATVLAVADFTPGTCTSSSPVELFTFNGAGPLTAIAPIPATQVSGPVYGEFGPGGQLFFSDCAGPGSITWFSVDGSGKAAPAGAINGDPNLANVHGLAVSPWGELFAVGYSNGIVSRYTFDSSGKAVANGTFTSPGTNHQGLAFSSQGELFASGGTSIYRFRFDAGHSVSPNGSIPVAGTQEVHGLGFSPWGELFAADPYKSTVYRFTFDGSGNAVVGPTFAVAGGAIAMAFSQEGEMFVTSHFAGQIERFTFDSSHATATPTGTMSTPTLAGIAISPRAIDPPPPADGGAADAGGADAGGEGGSVDAGVGADAGGAGGTGDAGGADSGSEGGSGNGGGAPGHSGCGCRLGATPDSGPALPLAVLVAAVVLGRRRVLGRR